MKIISVLFFVSVCFLPNISRAAFVTCEDAHNYGWNTSVLFTNLVYKRADCDSEFIDVAEQTLSRIWATPLTTNDTDEEKVCYFDGIYEGLTDRLSFEYKTCYFETGQHVLFGCVPIETMAMFAASSLLGLYSSIEEVTNEEVLAIFDQELNYAICEETEEGSCANTISDMLLENIDIEDAFLIDSLTEIMCPEENI